ncbi:MAG: ATP-dependent Clp protease adaptor ClpS [Planctomycetota bacterium]
MSTTILPARPDARTRDDRKPKRQPPYHVILRDDDDHSYDYVIRMLQSVFGYPPERGYQLACEVDEEGRVILLTTTLEHAELKRDQIHAFGPDPLLARSAGSMSAVLEPAE